MEKAHVHYVSGDMFSAFGLKPALGRLLTPDDDTTPGAHPVAVISYDYWTRRFQNDPVKPGVAIEPLRAKLDSVTRAFETERSKSWVNESPEEIASVLGFLV